MFACLFCCCFVVFAGFFGGFVCLVWFFKILDIKSRAWSKIHTQRFWVFDGLRVWKDLFSFVLSTSLCQ